MLGSLRVEKDSEGRLRDHLGNHAAAFSGGDDEPDKGVAGGSCNVQACQRPKAFHKNENLYPPRYYCKDCAWRLNRAHTGNPNWLDIQFDPEAALTAELQVEVREMK